MKHLPLHSIRRWRHGLALCCAGLGFAAGTPCAQADYLVNLSVKVIRKPDTTRPSGGIADWSGVSGFNSEVIRGNTAVRDEYGYTLKVTEFIDITPPVPAGQPADYWYSLDARGNKAVVEAAALADQATWAWRTNAINIYINDSSSGQCSFPPNSLAITLGKSIAAGTVIHEIGHFFNLRHTHLGDNDGMLGPWTDGDGLPETLPDDPDATLANLQAQYPSQLDAAATLFNNVMSYHNENSLLPVQIAIWDAAVSDHVSRRNVLKEREVYVSTSGTDSLATNDGSAGAPFRTYDYAYLWLFNRYVRPPRWTIRMVGNSPAATTVFTGSGYLGHGTPHRLEAIGGPVKLLP